MVARDFNSAYFVCNVHTESQLAELASHSLVNILVTVQWSTVCIGHVLFNHVCYAKKVFFGRKKKKKRYVRWSGIREPSLEVLQGTFKKLLLGLSAEGLTKSAKKDFFWRNIIMCCQEKWANVTQRDPCEWKEALSNTSWVFGLSSRYVQLFITACETEMSLGQWVEVVFVCVVSRFKNHMLM